MSVTRTQIADALSQRIGDYLPATATGGNAWGTTVTTADSRVLRHMAGSLKGYYLEVLSGTCEGESCQITDHTSSGRVTTLTLNGGFSAAIANGVTLRIHRLDPAQKYDAINFALRESWDVLPREVIEEFLGPNLLRNPNFEQWRTAEAAATVTVTITGTHTGGTATFVVAASDAKSYSKAAADYLCDGTADEAQINAALVA